jgi:hypothetical protein
VASENDGRPPARPTPKQPRQRPAEGEARAETSFDPDTTMQLKAGVPLPTDTTMQLKVGPALPPDATVQLRVFRPKPAGRRASRKKAAPAPPLTRVTAFFQPYVRKLEPYARKLEPYAKRLAPYAGKLKPVYPRPGRTGWRRWMPPGGSGWGAG